METEPEQVSPEEAQRRDRERKDRNRAKVQARKKCKKDYSEKWEQAVKKARENRWKSVKIVGEKVGTKKVNRKEYTVEKRIVKKGGEEKVYPIFYPGITNEPGTVYAVLKADDAVGYRVGVDAHEGEPSLWASLTDIDFDPDHIRLGTYDRLSEKQKIAKGLEFTEISNQERRRLTKIESELTIEFEPCRVMAIQFARWAGHLPKVRGEAVDWPIDDQEKGRGLFGKLVEEYGKHYFTSPEAVSMGAMILRRNVSQYPQWFQDDPSYWDVFLWKVHEYFFRRFGSLEQRAVSEMKNVPYDGERGTEFIGEQEELGRQRDFHGLDKDIITSKDAIKLLSNISPVANAALKVPPAPTPGAPKPTLNHPESHFIRNAKFSEWINHYYIDHGITPDFPKSIGPYNYVTLRARPSRKSTAALGALREAAEELQDYAHWELVAMVWRDFMVPAASKGNAKKVEQCHHELMVAVSGHGPDQIDVDGSTMDGEES